MKEFRVVMFIRGHEVCSSAIYAGTLENCQTVCDRMNRRTKGTETTWRVLECV